MAKAEKKLEIYIFSLADDEVIVGAALGEFFVKCLSVFMSVCVSFVMCVRGCTSSFQKVRIHAGRFTTSSSICYKI